MVKIFKSHMIILFVFSAVLIVMSCMKGGTLATITVTPVSAVIPTEAPQQFTATATFTDGTTLNWTTSVTWKLTDTNGGNVDEIATVGNTPGTNGLVTVLTNTAGTLTITATETVNNISGSAKFNVTNTPLMFITVTPIDQIVSVSTSSLAYAATGTYADGSTFDLTKIVTWTSSNTSVAMISNTADTNGKVTIIGPGNTDITATSVNKDIADTTVLSVLP